MKRPQAHLTSCPYGLEPSMETARDSINGLRMPGPSTSTVMLCGPAAIPFPLSGIAAEAKKPEFQSILKETFRSASTLPVRDRRTNLATHICGWFFSSFPLG